MAFHEETINGLRSKECTVGEEYVQTLPDGSGHHFISVNGVDMPVEYARDMNRGLVTLAEITVHMARQRSN